MADATPSQTHVSGSGSVTVRQRPSLLLMKVTLSSASRISPRKPVPTRKSAEETLVFVDRLQFEAADLAGMDEAADPAGADEPADELQPWASPEEQFQRMMAQFNTPAADDRAPQFLFIAQLGEEQLEQATAKALSLARQDAERLARAMEVRLGGQEHYVHVGVGELDPGRADKLLSRQRCGALLAGSAYDLGKNEIVSDDSRSVEFTVTVGVTYHVE